MSNFWDKKRVVITGGSGFLGNTLARKLSELEGDVNFVVLQHDEYTDVWKQEHKIQGDLRDMASVERLFRDRVDVVFHFGAQPIVSYAQKFPIQTIETNVLGTANLLDAIRRRDRVSFPLVICMSTDKVYGRTKSEYLEGMPLQGSEQVYEASKCAMEYICMAYKHSYSIPLVITRSSNMYGPGDSNWSRLIPAALRSAFTGEPLYYRGSKSEKHIRDYIHVEDVADGCIKLAEKFYSKRVDNLDVMNFGSGVGTQTSDLIDKIRELGDHKFEVKLGNDVVENEIDVQVMNVDRAAHLLNWFPKYSLDEGLKNTAEWYHHAF